MESETPCHPRHQKRGDREFMSGELERSETVVEMDSVGVRVDGWSPATCERVLTADRTWSVKGAKKNNSALPEYSLKIVKFAFLKNKI